MQRWHTTIGLATLGLCGIALAPQLSAPQLSAPQLSAPLHRQRAPEVPNALPIAGALPVPLAPPKTDLFLAFDAPPAPRRLPARPSWCTQAPPGGADQYVAIDNARHGACAASLQAVQAGMSNSIDHCRLYTSVWLCFDEVDQKPFQGARFSAFSDLAATLDHLEGTHAEQRALLGGLPELATVPAVYHPAADGLEARLDAYGSDPELQRAVHDLFGEPTVADHLGKDLLLEAEIARAISRVPASERTPAMETVRARRVYVVASALGGDVGALVRVHRKELSWQIEEALAEATRGDVPAAVREALEVARGERPLPRITPEAPF